MQNKNAFPFLLDFHPERVNAHKRVDRFIYIFLSLFNCLCDFWITILNIEIEIRQKHIHVI